MFRKKFFAISAVLALFAVSVNAQEVPAFDPESDYEDSYITNPWYDNWTIGLSAGLQTQAGPNITHLNISPAVELYAIKWVIPSLAVRFGYTGFNGKDTFNKPGFYTVHNIGNHSFWSEAYDVSSNSLKYNRNQFHFDLIWNATNTLLGYRYDRFWTISPYLTGGYMRLSPGKFFDEKADNEMYTGLGLYNTFRISKHLNLTFDARFNSYSSRYQWSTGGQMPHVVALAGISYSVHKTNWMATKDLVEASNKAVVSAQAAQKEAEESALAAAESAKKAKAQLDDANKEIDKLKATPAAPVAQEFQDELLARIAAAEHVVYYVIDVETPDKIEAARLAAYIRTTLDKDPQHVFYLTGSADKGTGTAKRNIYLSQARANGIKSILMKEYGVPESRIVIKATIVTDKHEDGSLDRCVLLEKN